MTNPYYDNFDAGDDLDDFRAGAKIEYPDDFTDQRAYGYPDDEADDDR